MVRLKQLERECAAEVPAREKDLEIDLLREVTRQNGEAGEPVGSRGQVKQFKGICAHG